MSKLLLLYSLFILLSPIKMSAQFIGDLLDDNRESEYDRVISQLNSKKAIYKVNKVKKANFLDEYTQEEGVYFIDTSGLIYKIVLGGITADVEYRNEKVSMIHVVDTFFNTDYVFNIVYRKELMKSISVTLPDSNYVIGFRYKIKGDRRKKEIFYRNSSKKKINGLKIFSVKSGNVEVIEGQVHNKKFKTYLIDSVSVLDEYYERRLNGSIETIRTSNTGILKKNNGRYIQAGVRYSSILPYATIKVVCFNELKLPVRSYYFEERGQGIYYQPDIHISQYKKDLIEEELMTTWDKDGKESVNNISSFLYKYEYYD